MPALNTQNLYIPGHPIPPSQQSKGLQVIHNQFLYIGVFQASPYPSSRVERVPGQPHTSDICSLQSGVALVHTNQDHGSLCGKCQFLRFPVRTPDPPTDLPRHLTMCS